MCVLGMYRQLGKPLLFSAMKLFVLLFLFTISPLTLFSQTSNLGNWIIYFGNKQIDNKWNWHHEVQYRNYNAIGDMEQLLLRTGFGYNLTENNNNLLLGYGYVLSENYLDGTDMKQSIKEHRVYQQFITKQRFSRVALQHRYRFEQRWVESDFKLRFRYFLALNVALSNKTLVNNTLYLSAYNEVFLNTKSTVFDRNRLYGGLGYKFNKLIRVEVGYMNQFFSQGSRDQINLVSFLSF